MKMKRKSKKAMLEMIQQFACEHRDLFSSTPTHLQRENIILGFNGITLDDENPSLVALSTLVEIPTRHVRQLRNICKEKE